MSRLAACLPCVPQLGAAHQVYCWSDALPLQLYLILTLILIVHADTKVTFLQMAAPWPRLDKHLHYALTNRGSSDFGSAAESHVRVRYLHEARCPAQCLSAGRAYETRVRCECRGGRPRVTRSDLQTSRTYVEGNLAQLDDETAEF